MNERLGELPVEARLLYAGLWTLADREGRLENRPKVIKAFVFPYDRIDVTISLSKLTQAGFLIPYSENGEDFFLIPKFGKHQKIHPNEAQSVIPVPPDDVIKCNVITLHSPTRLDIENTSIGISKDISKGKEESKDAEIPYMEIISHLNQLTGKKFTSTSDATRELIRGRWKEGFRLDDFRRVHKNKTDKWLQDPKMVDYLRPATLYARGNFESYLNEIKPQFKQPDYSRPPGAEI